MEKREYGDLSEDLRHYAFSLGVELYGVASAEAYAQRFPEKQQPGLFLKNAQAIVVIGVPYEPTTVSTVLRAEDLVPFYDPRFGSSEADGLSHEGPASTWFLSDEKLSIYRELNWIGYKMTKWLRRKGYSAFHFSVNKKDNRTLKVPFEHRASAYLAGLGTMGLNCCILTPEFGARVLITSIVTDCGLQMAKPLDRQLCKRCGLCVKRCPVAALDGEGGMDRFRCAREGRCCGICIAVCPVGDLKVPKM